uniref:SERPIN domain-containing protein n=1 Tax=Taenia asiatica TaxID=60517 RepID=A0A0R3W297_TAEAS
LVGPTGPALGVALLLGDETRRGVELVMRAGSLRHFSLEEGGTSFVQLQAVFHDTSEAHRLRILRDLRLHLAVPCLEEDNFSFSQQRHHQELGVLFENPQLRVFKPLKFSHEGSLVCVAFPQSEDALTTPADSIVLRPTPMGLLVSHFASDVPLIKAVFAVERLNLSS